MLAVKGHYRQGRIELDTPIAGVDEADVIVVIADQTTTRFMSAFQEQILNSPAEVVWDDLDAFEAASLETFFQEDDDKDVDWLEVFDVKNR